MSTVLHQQTVKAIARALGLTEQEVACLSQDELDARVEKQIGHRLEHTVNLGGLIARGNPLLALGRFLNHKKVIERFDKAFE